MGLLPREYKLSQELSETFKEIRVEVVKDAFELFDERAKQHDSESPFWHRYPFGDQSYAQMVFETAGRLVSAVQIGLSWPKLEDRLLDLINWAVMWLVWRRMARQQRLDMAEPVSSAEQPAAPVGELKSIPGLNNPPKRSRRLSLKRKG